MGISLEGKTNLANNNISSSDHMIMTKDGEMVDNIMVTTTTCKLKELKIKKDTNQVKSSSASSFNGDDHHDHDHDHDHDHVQDQILAVDEDDDGFKTPTGKEHKIPEPKTCPPAPRRAMAPQPIKRRRVMFDSDNEKAMRFFEVTNEDLELLFPPRSILVKENNNIHDRPGSIKKVKKANLTTLKSLR